MGNFIADRGIGWVGFPDKEKAHFYVEYSGGQVWTSLCKEHTTVPKGKAKPEVSDHKMLHCKKCQILLTLDWGR